MTPEEAEHVKLLDRNSRMAMGCAYMTAIGLTAWMGALSGVIGLMISFGFPDPYRLRFCGTGVLTGIAFMAWLLWPQVTWELGIINADEEDEVELLHVHAFSVKRSERGFTFDTGDKEPFHIDGTAARMAALTGRFPNRYFTIVRLPRADRILRIDCHGEPLP